jgi:type I restriction enzyme M protein
MTDNSSDRVVQKLWNYCNILCDDGLSYLLARRAQASGDYTSAWLSTGSEQLTFLLFLKMADEPSRPLFNKPARIPKGFDWASLLSKDGDELEIHYRHLLETLGKERGKLDARLVNLEKSPEESNIGIDAR